MVSLGEAAAGKLGFDTKIIRQINNLIRAHQLESPAAVNDTNLR